jgi:hypothetical protein
MARARLLAGGTLVAGMALCAFVYAQQPRAGGAHAGAGAKPGGAKPKGSASAGGDNPYSGDQGSAGAAAPSASGVWPPVAATLSDAGPVPAPPPAAATGGQLSPLNPAANEFSDGGAPPMQIDYDRLLADVAALRARVAAVSDTLFHSRIAVGLETTGDHGRIAGLSVSLDDGVVWTAPAHFAASDLTTVYEHSVAPGHHAVTLEIERRDDRDENFRTTQRSRFIVDVPADQRLGVALKVWDDSNMGGDFESDKKGGYDLRVRLRAKAEPIPR